MLTLIIIASAAASSVCADLSDTACPGTSTDCSNFAAGTFVVGTGVNHGARVTGIPGVGWAMGAAMVGGLVL